MRKGPLEFLWSEDDTTPYMAETPGAWEAQRALLAGLSPLVLALGDGGDGEDVSDDEDDDASDSDSDSED